LLDRAEQMLAPDADTIRALAHRQADLGRDHHLLARRIVQKRCTENFLALARVIGVGRVEEIDAAIERPLDEGAALARIEGAPAAPALGTPGIAAEPDHAHLEAAPAEGPVTHRHENLAFLACCPTARSGSARAAASLGKTA